MTDPSTTGSSEPIFRLVYRSHNRIPQHQRKAELGAIFSVARSKNKKAGVTGALLILDDWFVQALEGDESVVRALYETIRKDARHERISLLEERSGATRTFDRWAMARVSEDGEPDIPLITNVNKGGAVRAAARPVTPEQESVLQFMRNSVRENSHAK